MDMENLFKLNTKENLTGSEAKYKKILIEPYQHIDEAKGKEFRTTLIKMYNHWMKLDKAEMPLIIEYCRWIHTAFLTMDDIQDSSEMRRGNPATQVVYGVGRTITAIDLANINLFVNRMWNKSQEFHREQLTCALTILQGQAMEMFWRDNFICPSEGDYLDMIYRKTGYYLYAISNYMQVYSKIKIEHKKLSILFGMYFQMADDYRGLKSKFHCASKGFCDDIREGKFILPVIHAINSRPNDTRVLDILKMRTTDDNVKMKCLKLLEEFGSLEYTMNKIIWLKTLITPLGEKLGISESFKKIFDICNHDT